MAEPVAPAVNVGLAPAATIWLAGELVNLGGEAAGAILNVKPLLVDEPWPTPNSQPVMVAVKLPANVGVPAMVPVVALNVTPGAGGAGAELQAWATCGEVVRRREVNAVPTVPVIV